MILTMTTVGYGDIFPITPGGRVFTIIACIIGTFVVSLIISQLTSLIKLEPDQEKAYDEIMNEESRKNLDKVLHKRVDFFIKYKVAKLRKKQFKEVFKVQAPYFKFREQMEYNSEYDFLMQTHRTSKSSTQRVGRFACKYNSRIYQIMCYHARPHEDESIENNR